MRTAGLLLVLLIARAGALAGRSLEWSWWLPAAYLWQDAAVVVLFAVGDLALGRRRRVMWSVYALAVLYVAVDVPVIRVLSTPLTWAMWRAARGPLSDSLRYYVTPANVCWMAAVVAAGAAAPWFLRRIPTRTLVAVLLPIVAVGPPAAAHVETHGLDRNAWTALAVTALPRIAAEPAHVDWRAPRRDATALDDLTPLRGMAEGRHIVLVSLESTAAQYLGAYAAAPDVMPNLSALARDGIVFDNAYAVYPESIKGLFSILCSTYPAFDRPVETYAGVRCRSVAAVLADGGYRTALFHSGRFGYLGMDAVIHNRGFDLLEDAGDIGGQHESSFGVDEGSTVARILEWVDGLRNGERFFVTYLPIAGHHPYDTGRSAESLAQHQSSVDSCASLSGERNEFDRYRNTLRYSDAALGALVAGLRDRGLSDRTAWIVFGDHGEAFGQHEGNYGHTFQLYEENVRVPLVVAVPGRSPHPLRSPRVVSLIDIAPTVLDLAGVPAPDLYQGISALDGNRRMALFFADYSLGLLGLRDGRMKFIHELDSGRSKLFDLAADPGEMRNLADRHADDAWWYAAHLRRWSAAQKDRLR